MIEPDLADEVAAAVAAWMRWVARWTPAAHRGKSRLCRRCTGSPLVEAAGIPTGTPHQVTHALVSRMHRIIDRRVDTYTERALPTLHAELTDAALWKAAGYDPRAGLDPEYDGLDPDPEPMDGTQPYLFTLAGLATETSVAEPALPRPPLTDEERVRLRHEMQLADRVAADTGNALCHTVQVHQGEIRAAVDRFVEPQIVAMLAELSQQLEPPQ